MMPGAVHKRVLKSFWLLFFISLALYGYTQEDRDTTNSESSFYFDSIDKTTRTYVQERQVPDSIIQRLQGDEAFWYANAELKKSVLKKREMPFLWQLLQQPWVRNLLWILIAGSFAAVLIWYLSSLNIQLFYAKPRVIFNAESETLPDNVFSIHFEKEIDRAVQHGNYRMAVRLLYLQVLTGLAKKNIIQYGQDRTNSEYLQQLYGTDYYQDFFILTRQFEYAWYGQFAIAAPAYENIRNNFVHFKQRLNF